MDFPHSFRKLKTLWIHVLCVGSVGTKHTHPSIVCLKPLFVFGHIELAAVLALSSLITQTLLSLNSCVGSRIQFDAKLIAISFEEMAELQQSLIGW